MMEPQATLKPNHPNVIHEVIDGEAILVNLESGSYFSLDKVGAVVWRLIEQGARIGHLIDMVGRQYAGTRKEIEIGVSKLVGELQSEGLIVTADAAPTPGNQTPEPVAVDRPEFEAPVLQKYTDMEDLIMLDPIHDVDESGWPNIKQEQQQK